MTNLSFPALAFAALVLAGCTSTHRAPEPPPASLIRLDLSILDEDGLRGPPGGKVAVAYEFCIPTTEPHRAEVLNIDRTVQFMPSSPGRIGCSNTQYLCIGSTHQPNYRDVLSLLANLPYVTEIRRCDFE